MENMNDSGTKEPRMWERAWTADEMRKNSANWTLAGDAGLLNGMESLAQNLLMKTQEMQKEVDSLSQETRATGSRLHNAITDFLMLSNVQFVENRVYDEEVQDENVNNENKTAVAKKSREEREAELVPRISEAVKFGLNVVENAFEKHQVVDSESEEEEDNSLHALPILKPKDFYSHRPLPYVIGSEKFMQDDYAGLEEAQSDEEDESEKDEMDEIQEQRTKDSTDESTDESEDEETDAKQVTNKKASISALNEKRNDDSEEDGELFGAKRSDDGFSSEDDAKSNTSDPQATTAQANFAAELAAKLGVSQQVPVTAKEKSDKAEDLKNSKRRDSKSKEIQEEVDEIGDDDDDEPLFKRKNSLFGSGGGLFDDLNEDDENDLFSDIKPEKPKPKPQKDTKRKESIEKIHKKSSVSLFDEPEDDLFSATKMADEKKSKRSESKAISLFDDAEDDDDDLFSTTTRKKTQSIHVEKDDDLFDSPAKREHSTSTSSDGTPKKKLPAGAVPMVGSLTNPMAELFKARSLSESEKIETDKTIKSMPKMPEEAVEDVLAAGDSTKSDEIASKNARSRTISLFDDFDDDDEDDLFKDVKPKEKIIKEAKIVEPVSSDSSKTSSIFDTEEDTNDDIFQKKAEPKLRATSLFDDENILFGGPSEDAPSVDLFKTPEKDVPAETDAEISSARKQSASLFDAADDDEDLFSAPKVTKTPTPAPRKPSATIKSAPESAPKPPTESPTKKKPVGGVSLFGGIDPFAGALKSTVEPKVEPKQPESAPDGPSLTMERLTRPDELAVSFDLPPEPHTLKSNCKNRAAVQKRRPPTRKNRTAAAEVQNDEVDAKPAASPVNDILSPSTEEEDVLTVDELLESEVAPTIFSQNGAGKNDDLFAGLDSKTEDDIFAAPRKTKSVLAADEEDDDLFTRASKTTQSVTKKDLFGGSKFEAKKTVASLFDDDSEDDIFADSKTTKNAKPSKEQIVAKKSTNLFADDDDDVSIFDDPLMVKRGNL